MRKKDNMRNVGELIKKVLDKHKLSDKLIEYDAIDIWKEIIGKQLSIYISDEKIYKNKLYIKTNSSSLRNELSYKKTDLISQINTKVGKNLISDIIFN